MYYSKKYKLLLKFLHRCKNFNNNLYFFKSIYKNKYFINLRFLQYYFKNKFMRRQFNKRFYK